MYVIMNVMIIIFINDIVVSVVTFIAFTRNILFNDTVLILKNLTDNKDKLF